MELKWFNVGWGLKICRLFFGIGPKGLSVAIWDEFSGGISFLGESEVVNNVSVDGGFLGAPTPGVEGDPTPLKEREECNIVTRFFLFNWVALRSPQSRGISGPNKGGACWPQKWWPPLEAATQLYTQPPEPKASSVRRVQTQLWEPCLTLRLSPRSRTSGTRILRVKQHVRPLHPPSDPRSSLKHN